MKMVLKPNQCPYFAPKMLNLTTYVYKYCGASFLLYLPLDRSIFFSKEIDAAQAHFRSCYAYLGLLSVSSIGPKPA
jgi:hypothetical protein